MLDLKALREDPDAFRAGLARRGAADALDAVLALDGRVRALKTQVEELRAEQNRASKEIGRAAPEERQARIDAGQALAAKLKEHEPELQRLQDELDGVLLRIPNVPHDSVPDGRDDDDNVLVKEVGTPTAFDFEPKDHLDLGGPLRLLDMERAARTSGSRFVYLMGPGVWLELALVRYALDVLAGKGFIPMIPPVLVREEAMYGTGFLPTDESQIYATRDDDLYLVGTSEVPLASFHQDEILEASSLPVRYAGFSTCFRREAGTYGKDTRGMFRVHQFDKVEMFSFCAPDRSWDEHEFLVSVEEELVTGLGIPYRLMNVCTGELGASAAKKIDLEAWFPGQSKYRELTSCSNCTDYQARRLGVRVKGEREHRPVHTLNGTACAVGRTLIAVLENHQLEDGSVELPEVLHNYLPRGLETLRPAPRATGSASPGG
jgi:seryl-tRNA synthetase